MSQEDYSALLREANDFIRQGTGNETSGLEDARRLQAFLAGQCDGKHSTVLPSSLFLSA